MSKSLPRIASPIATLVMLCLVATATAQPKDAKPSAAALERHWADLASPDEIKSARAILALAAAPNDSVPFLKARLRPVKVDADGMAKLVKQLESAKFPEREAASRELKSEIEYLGKYAKPALEKHLAESPSAEARRRVREAIDAIPADAAATPAAQPLTGRQVGVRTANGQIQIMIDGKVVDLNPPPAKPPPGPPAAWVRAARAAAILDHIGTSDARAVLERMAGGEPDALPTKAARAALDRPKP